MLWIITHQECHPPQLTFFLVSSTGRDTTTSRLSVMWMSLSPTLQARPCYKRGTTRLWQWSLLHIEKESSLWSGFATLHRRKRLKQDQ